jgi:uncharacterized protein GlcG (DUF336 family)
MKKHKLLVMIAISIFTLPTTTVSSADSPYITTRSLSAPMAMQLALAAHEDCTSKGYHVAAAVVDRQGRLLALVRSPLSGPHTAEVSQGKAYTAATFKTPTTQLMGRDFMRDIPGALVFGGGMPINIGGHFYGGVGVSGAPEKTKPGDVDDECAAAGIASITEEIELSE